MAMEAVFVGNSQTSANVSLTKRDSSPKDGSLSGDEGSGSDGGQKAEMEDSQSNCSKVSSDLTPSDDRSNEEAGSSMKESDNSMKNMKGVSSIASSNSSNDQNVQEEGLGASVKESEDVFNKLFVPLKIQVTQKLDAPSTPYWLIEAHFSHRVAMTYKVPTRQLEDVLIEDKKKISNLVQTATVKQQLLQLLNEVDTKSEAVTPTPVQVSSSSYLPVKSTSPTSVLTQSSLITDCFLKTEKDEISSNEGCVNSAKLIIAEKSANSSTDFIHQFNSESVQNFNKACNVKTDKSDTKSFLCEETAHLNVTKSCFIDSLNDLYSSRAKKASHKQEQSTGENSSDTNTDLIADELNMRSSELGHSSSTDITTICKSSLKSCISSPADSNIQEKFQAMESSSLTGQSIEDIIMSKVFFPQEVSVSGHETKMIFSMFDMMD